MAVRLVYPPLAKKIMFGSHLLRIDSEWQREGHTEDEIRKRILASLLLYQFQDSRTAACAR